MKQLTQKLKEGKINIIDCPIPHFGRNEILVRNIFSCISAGTESSTVKAARKSYIGKAKERPEQFKQVINTLRTAGPVQTYRAVMKKLDAHSSLGYSCVGEVIDVGSNVREFKVGDYAACGGGSACHAEVVAVPENLSVKLDPSTDLKQATYNTIGAISMQGVRQADLRLGESCAVIGLGLIGQITCALLKASGVTVIGVDIAAKMVQFAKDHYADQAFERNSDGIQNKILELTNGMGCDAVIITAASSSLDPINFAGAIARKKASIVVVGAVPTGYDREPNFYQKELTVKMSCSYGPGRYDPDYEEKGNDYPYAYVRWTEKRNMASFQDLIARKQIDLSHLTTNLFDLENAENAYDMILSKSEPFIGILLKYNTEVRLDRRVDIQPSTFIKGKAVPKVRIGFIGAGSYAQGNLLPNLQNGDHTQLEGVMTTSSANSRSVADRFNFNFCTSNADEIIHNKDINTVFIATRHDTHGRYVIESLKAGKHVFVEKPLCLKETELQEISDIMQAIKANHGDQKLMVGYNRRFSPLSRKLKQFLNDSPMSVLYRINAGSIPAESWIQDMEVGGGRLLGEVCHFIDYLIYLTGDLPKDVYATVMKDEKNLNDTLTLTITQHGGSIGTIHYFANGSKSITKEYIEVFQSGSTGKLDNFKQLDLFGSKKPQKVKLMSQDKGQRNEVQSFIDSILSGGPADISFEEIFATSQVAFKAIISIKERAVVELI